jgi:hypothetical protein
MQISGWRIAIVVALLGSGAALTAALAHALGLPRPMLLLAVGAVAFAYASVVVLVMAGFALQRAANRLDPTPKVRGPDRWAAAWREVRRMAVCMLWWHPFRVNAHPDHLPGDGEAPWAQGQRGVVLVHGFFCNRGFWNQWMPRLKAAGVPFVAVNLLPAFGRMDDYPPLIDAAVRRVAHATGQAPVLLCHSMGGLAARAWLQQVAAGSDGRGGPQAPAAHIVTLGTPHHGTALAQWAFSPNGRQMRLGSPWLANNGKAIVHLSSGFTCYYSDADQIVAPAATATLEGADNRLLPASGHLNLAWRSEPWAQVMQLCGRPPTA